MQDPVLRHAAVMGLAGAADGSHEALLAARQASFARGSAGRAARTPAAVVRPGRPLPERFRSAARRRSGPGDSRRADSRRAAAAGGADHARRCTTTPCSAACSMPTIRLGTPENAAAIAAYAGRGDAPEAMRLEALDMLGELGQAVESRPRAGHVAAARRAARGRRSRGPANQPGRHLQRLGQGPLAGRAGRRQPGDQRSHSRAAQPAGRQVPAATVAGRRPDRPGRREVPRDRANRPAVA